MSKSAKAYRMERDEATELLDECTTEKHGLEDSILYLKKQLEDKHANSKWVIEIGAQSFEINDYTEASKKVKGLMDLGVWYVKLKEKKGVKATARV